MNKRCFLQFENQVYCGCDGDDECEKTGFTDSRNVGPMTWKESVHK